MFGSEASMNNTEVQITHNTRYGRIYAMSETEYATWLLDEKRYWQMINTAARAAEDQNENIDKYLWVLDQITSHSRTENDYFEKSTEQFRLPFHDDNGSDTLLHLAQKGQLSLALYLNEIKSSLSSELYVSSYKSGLIDLENSITANLYSKIQEAKQSLKTHTKVSTEDIDSKIKYAEEKITGISDAATNSIHLTEPVTYWASRATKHRAAAKKYSRFACVFAIVMTTLIGLIIYEAYLNANLMTIWGIEIYAPFNKFGIALIILLSTATIWSSRILIKLMMANIALEIEAMEKETMIKTFISMSSTNITQSEQTNLLFYTTLFRPTASTLTDDSTSPEYIKIIEALASKTKQ
jgi:hypothetical protein